MAKEHQFSTKRTLKIEVQFLESLNRRCPHDIPLLKALGDLYTQIGRYGDGLRIDLKLAQLCPNEAEVWYNLGCSLALIERRDEAFEALHQAIALGYRDVEWMAKDSDLESLHEDQRFENLLSRIINADMSYPE